MITRLEEFETYQLSMKIGEEVWRIVEEWDFFAKSTIGRQLVKAVDSIAANLSEGLGRYHYRETKNFNFYARGSLFETKTWLRKANNRNLIHYEKYKNLIIMLDIIGKKINNYNNSIGKKTY